MKKNTIIVVESTVAPNVTRHLIIPTIEKLSKLKLNKDFYVAVVPERIRPNYIYKQLTTFPRVIGISDPKILNVMNTVYKDITSGTLDFVDLTTAETVKTVENSFRDVNIAFANQIALACEELGVNVWQVRELVNKSPFHNLHKPGPGVGGHCIPKDPWLLSSSVKNGQLSIVKESRKTNDSMPKHLYDLIKLAFKQKKIDIKKAKICVLGYSYIEDTDDVRNSPTQTLLDLLKLDKIKYTVHDPNVDGYKKNLLGKIRNSDCIVLVVGHKEYKILSLKKLAKLINKKILIDGKNFFDKKVAEKYGFTYKGIGNI